MIENSRFHITNTLGGPMLTEDLCAMQNAAPSNLASSVRNGVSSGLARGFEPADSLDAVIKQLSNSDMEGEDVVANYLSESKVSRKEQIAHVMGPSFDRSNDISGPSISIGSRPSI